MGAGRVSRFRNGQGREFQADQGFWVRALMLASEYGWQPERQRSSYLAPDLSVSASDAQNLRQAFERLFERALAAPTEVLPLPVEVGELDRLREFLSGGAFGPAD